MIFGPTHDNKLISLLKTANGVKAIGIVAEENMLL